MRPENITAGPKPEQQPLTIDIVILAAGQGTRMRSSLPKVLHPIGGKPMLEHVVDAASAIPDSSVHVVVGHGAESVQQRLQGKCQFVVQEQQLGTGHAVHQALPGLRPGGVTLVLYGDVPLIRTETLLRMVEQTSEESIAVLTANMNDPTGYGRIVRDVQGRVAASVEQKDATADQRAITEINTGIMALPTSHLANWLPRLGNDNVQNEYYLTDIVGMAAEQGLGIQTPHPGSQFEIEGVNDRVAGKPGACLPAPVC